jgi:hypothetical protein
MTAYVVISEVNEAGAESYSSAQFCTGEGSTSTVEHLLDQ